MQRSDFVCMVRFVKNDESPLHHFTFPKKTHALEHPREYFFVNGILHKSSKKSAGLTSETQSQPENELSGHTLAG